MTTQPSTQEPTREELLFQLSLIRNVLASDGLASSCQTLGQYRTIVLKAFKEITSE